MAHYSVCVLCMWWFNGNLHFGSRNCILCKAFRLSIFFSSSSMRFGVRSNKPDIWPCSIERWDLVKPGNFRWKFYCHQLGRSYMREPPLPLCIYSIAPCLLYKFHFVCPIVMGIEIEKYFLPQYSNYSPSIDGKTTQYYHKHCVSILLTSTELGSFYGLFVRIWCSLDDKYTRLYSFSNWQYSGNRNCPIDNYSSSLLEQSKMEQTSKKSIWLSKKCSLHNPMDKYTKMAFASIPSPSYWNTSNTNRSSHVNPVVMVENAPLLQDERE